jgi:argininosuccinate lyase
VEEKPWGGVFDAQTDRRVERFTESVRFDRRLYAQDIRGSIAHVQMLAKVGLIPADEAAQIEKALGDIRSEIASGRFELKVELEDIHMNIERALIDRLGDVGRKVHTARSRNDQVATDLRLWVRDAIDHVDALVLDLERAWVGRTDRDAGVILPGYTHLRRAQPVLASHYWLAYAEKFDRDRSRLADCRRRTNVLSLGTGALAGTSLPIDRHDVAQRLQFEDVARNSLDVSSDRDFVVEFSSVLCQMALHLSTWAEEWIIWSSTEFGFLQLPQAFCTGSSMMPQKVNPDVLELIRARTARVIGNHTRLLTLLKGLPLAYNRDLQEDKEPLFDSYDTVEAALVMAAPLVSLTVLNAQRARERLDEGHLDATTLMEALIRRGVPQRTAHTVVGKLVKKAIERGIPLSELTAEEIRSVYPAMDPKMHDVLGVERAVASFMSFGSTSPEQVEAQLRYWREKLQTATPLGGRK